MFCKLLRHFKTGCFYVLPAAVAWLTGCGKAPSAADASRPALDVPSLSSMATSATRGEQPKPSGAVRYTYEVVHAWPHDREAFTQGLVFLEGDLLESTGLYGQSTLRRVELQSGSVLQVVNVPAEYFAEGLAVVAGKAFQLTWQNHCGFVYDLKSLKVKDRFSYAGEGWGLTTDGQVLILSDGTSQLRFLDRATFAVKRTINVTHQTWPVDRLNELEYIKGEVWANIWGADYVVRIEPTTGKVTGIIDFTGLLPMQDRLPGTDVLNGIAYDAAADRLFVTGKRWPKVFEVRIRPK